MMAGQRLLGWSMAGLLALSLAAAAVTGSGAAPGPTPGSKLAAIALQDPEGKAHTLAEFASRKVLVIVFTGTECPISNSYAEPLSLLADRTRGQGVQFLAINANLGESRESVGAHAKDYGLTFPAFKDPKQALANALAARATPEAFVLDARRVVRYRGRIDDAYVSRTERRPAVTARDLEQALAAVLAGKPVVNPVTQALGCAIVRSPAGGAAPARGVTYHKDVEPIVQARCQSCHRPGQVGPFSLLTYADAKKWAGEIKSFTQSRQMPPWKAEPGHGDFKDVRRLTDAELGTIVAWVDAGAPAGSPGDAPPAKKWPEGWMLGKPDLVLTMPEEYEVAATGKDIYRCFVIPTGLTEDREVVGIELQPGNPRVVHHVLNFLDTRGRARAKDAADSGPGYTSFGGPGFTPDGGLGGWAPGNFPRFMPPGVGSVIPKNADLVMQVHYHKNGKVERDRTRVGIYFAKTPIQRRLRTQMLINPLLSIPPDAPRHRVTATLVLKNDIAALSITPHMHLVGKEMKVTATLPDGRLQPLVWVRDWDFKWQDSYQYQAPVELPKGTRLDLEAFYDNSPANPRNPNHPSKWVRWGEETTDEMCIAFIGYVLKDEAAAGS
jgi:peroxiredoxin